MVIFNMNDESDNTEQINSDEEKQEIAKRYFIRMIYGILWFFGGTFVTLVTYFLVTSISSGGTYIVAWGAILYGIITFIRGFYGWRKCKPENLNMSTFLLQNPIFFFIIHSFIILFILGIIVTIIVLSVKAC
jgi:hypothetical protein